MANNDLTSLLISKLQADYPEQVFSGEEAEARVLRAPNSWKRVGAWPVGSPEFLKASQQRLIAGERVAVLIEGGRTIMVFASPNTNPPQDTPRRTTGHGEGAPGRGPARRSTGHGEVAPGRLAAPAASLDKLPPRHSEAPPPEPANPFGAISPKLAGVLAAAEDSVQRAEAAAKARKAGHAPEAAAEGTAPTAPDEKALPPSKLPPRDLTPPPNTRRQLFAFMLLVSLFVYKVVTHEPEKQGKRQVDGMMVPEFPNPYKAEPLDALPSGKPPVVVRGGRLESSGKLDRKQVGRLVEAVIPLMRHCYHKALLADPAGAGEGEATFSMSWAEGGQIESVTAVSAPGNGTIEECGVAALSLIELPPELATEPATGLSVVRFKAAP